MRPQRIMLSSILAWLFYLINPITNQSIRAYQAQNQPRLEQGVVAANGPFEDIITGVYGAPPLIKIHDRAGNVKWSWTRNDAQQGLPSKIQACLQSSANDAVEVKYTRNGTSIAAIYSDVALIINHTPDNPSTDRQITFAVCTNGDLSNAHTLEVLPGGRVALATTGQRPWDGILVYNASAGTPLVDDPPILQNITGQRATHGMIWDEMENLLWAVGTDAAADGSDSTVAYGVLQGYPYNPTTGQLREDDAYRFRFPQAYDLESEWGKGYPWWSGPHDLVPIPNQRKFIISTDRDLQTFDIANRRFAEQGYAVVSVYLKGYQPTGNNRFGINRAGQNESLPRSDLKSVCIAPDGSFIYVQALWQEYLGNHTNIVVDGAERDINNGDQIYRSRWFFDTPGWTKPLT